MRTFSTLFVTSFLLFTSLTHPILAAEPETQVAVEPGGLRRIEVAGRLALAGEALRRETCVNGHEAEAMRRILRYAEDLDYLVWALREGSLSEGVLPMAHPKVLEKIAAAEPLIDEVELFFSPENSATLERLAKKTAAISKALDTQARFSVRDPSNAKLATLASRQAQDLAAMGANLCEALVLDDFEGDLKAMSKYLKRYTMISASLAEGNERKQIAAPPNEQIRTVMGQLDRQWGEVLPLLTRMKETGEIAEEDARTVQVLLADMLERYDFALYLYGTL